MTQKRGGTKSYFESCMDCASMQKVSYDTEPEIGTMTVQRRQGALKATYRAMQVTKPGLLELGDRGSRRCLLIKPTSLPAAGFRQCAVPHGAHDGQRLTLIASPTFNKTEKTP